MASIFNEWSLSISIQYKMRAFATFSVGRKFTIDPKMLFLYQNFIEHLVLGLKIRVGTKTEFFRNRWWKQSFLFFDLPKTEAKLLLTFRMHKPHSKRKIADTIIFKLVSQVCINESHSAKRPLHYCWRWAQCEQSALCSLRPVFPMAKRDKKCRT